MTTEMRKARGRRLGAVVTAVALGTALGVAACGGSSGPREMYYLTEHYRFSVTPEEAPPHARARIQYRVVINDRESRQPIQDGEGQIYASNRDGAKTWDGLVYGPEPGTYRGTISYVTSGVWAVAIRFRRDSLHALEKSEWMQDVLPERPSDTP